MAEFDINDIASIGAVRDVPPHMLPPEAWTIALNMRYVDEGLESLEGWAQVFGSPLFPPHFSMPVAGPAQNYWLYTSLNNAGAYDGTSHADVTRVSGLYTANESWEWNGTMLGGIAILNNGNDVPQYWPTASLAVKLADLPNFSGYTSFVPTVPPTHSVRAKVIRAFGPFLIATYITDNGNVFPHRVRWSHPAVPGGVPISWDVSDPTKDTGELDLPDVASGVLLDALPLGSNMYLYKEAAIWRMRYVGGQQIFDVGQAAWIATSGLLAPRCVCLTGDGQKHVLATQDDIIWHNGNTVQSILSRKQRKRLQNDMDTNNFHRSFMFANPFNNEVWFCYPSQGNVEPDRALILNSKVSGGDDFVVTEADGITFRNAIAGNIEAFVPEIWDRNEWINNTNYIVGALVYDDDPALGSTPFFRANTTHTSAATGTFAAARAASPGLWSVATPGDPDTWSDDTGPWARLERRRVILSNPNSFKLMKLDQGPTRDGVAFATLLQREGLGLASKKKNGDTIVDFGTQKMVTRVWPKVSTVSGGTVVIRFGSQQTVGGPTLWGSAVAYDPEQTTFADPGPSTGRALGIEFSRTGSWRIDGYKIEVAQLGKY